MESSNLELIIERIGDHDQEVQLNALKSLHSLISTTQGSASSNQQELFDKISLLEAKVKKMTGENQRYLYDLLSVMNLFHNDANVLKMRLLGGYTSLSDWGIQYARKLVCVILDVIYQKIETIDYSSLVEPLSDLLFSHNSEIDAIDFIFEVSFIPSKTPLPEDRNSLFSKDYRHLIYKNVDNDNRDRILLYLEEMDKFYHIDDILLTLYKEIPSKYLVFLIKINKIKEAVEYVGSITDSNMKKQLYYILARCNIYFECDDPEAKKILSNSFLSENLANVAASLELQAPLKLEHVFGMVESQMADVAAIANSLVHFAFCRDPIYLPAEKDFTINSAFVTSLLTQKSTCGMASVGLINSYAQEKVLEVFATEIYSDNDIGAILALAISAQRHHDLDKGILSLLSPFLTSTQKQEVIAALTGISIMYSATSSYDAYDLVMPLLGSEHTDIALYAIYCLGTIFSGSGDENIISSCLEVYNNIRNETLFNNLAILGISLVFMKNPHLLDADVYQSADKYIKILSLGLMNIGSGNPTYVDTILTEAFTGDTDALLESLGLISSCVIGIGDSVSTYLLDRICNSSLMLDSSHLKTVFPLCLAILYPSNPKPEILDVLEKTLTSGDSYYTSLLSLGIVGAGTKSAKISRILDSNYMHLYKDPKAVENLILAQGLINLGKGLFSLSPLFYEKSLISNRSMVGLLSTLTFYLDYNSLCDNRFMFYILSNAIVPKYITGYEGSCRIGKPVDTVGLIGKPNKISGAVVHSLPIVLNSNEKAIVEDDICSVYVEDVLVKKQ